jgi:hypothetical protein
MVPDCSTNSDSNGIINHNNSSPSSLFRRKLYSIQKFKSELRAIHSRIECKAVCIWRASKVSRAAGFSSLISMIDF